MARTTGDVLNLPLVPLPKSVTLLKGSVEVSKLQRITSPSDTREISQGIESWKKGLSGSRTGSLPFQIKLSSKVVQNAEGYRLQIHATGVLIEAAKPAGVFYAFQTLRQIESHGSLPCLDIEDEPRFKWRGAHLDVSRHFYDAEFIKRFIDQLAFLKLNTFHWHLVDGPGWRLPIRKYPRLTSIGAWRKDKRDQPWNWQATELSVNGRKDGDYGGSYSRSQIRDIVKYAKARFVTIVPEIEMPGHSYAALIAYPELSCNPDTIAVEGLHGSDTFCAGKEETFQFFEDVLSEVCEMFPNSPIIHVGGDEVSPTPWSRCPLCQIKLHQLGLSEPKELQPYFMNQIAKFLAKKGKRMMGWDEILDGTLPRDTAVTVWRNAAIATKAIAGGHPVVMCPTSSLYFDTKPQDLSPEKVYAFEPLPSDISALQSDLVWGIESCLWTENVQTPQDVSMHLNQRQSAMAEVAWTPSNRRDWSSFKLRLAGHMEQLNRFASLLPPKK